jgi:hypothetical protein
VAALIHIAAWRARVEAFHLSAEEAQASCPGAVGRAIGLSVAWLPELDTLGSEPPAANPPMPPLAELSNGLQDMLH